jgi:O-antigen ligase
MARPGPRPVLSRPAEAAKASARFTAAHASLLLIGLAWTLPFLQRYHPWPVPSYYSEWLAIAFGLAALAILPVAARTRTFPVPTIVAGLILLALLFLAHAGFGRMPYAGDALTAARYLAWAVMLVALGAWIRHALGMETVTAILAWFLLAGGAASAFAALTQHYQWDTPLNFFIAPKVRAEVYGNLGQIGQFSNYMVLATASSVYLYSGRRLSGLWFALCAAVFLFVLTLASSRATWLYLGVLALLAFALRRRLPNAESSRLCMATFLLLPVFVLAQWVATLSFMQGSTGLITSAEKLFDLAGGARTRVWLARVAWDMFTTSPLFGAGLGQYDLHNFEASAAWGGPTFVGVARHAHNIVLHLMAETGIVGAGIVVATALAWLLGLRRTPLGLHHWWLLALLGVLGAHSMLEYPLWYAYFLGMAAILLGVGATAHFEIKARLGVVIAVAAVMAGSYLLTASFANFRDFESTVYGSHAGLTAQERDALIDRQLALHHRDPVLAPYIELIISRTIPISQHQLPEKLALNTRVIHFKPIGDVVYRQAVLLALAGNREGADRRLRQLARIYPEYLPKAMAGLRELSPQYPDTLGPLLAVAAGELKNPAPAARRN